jgi:hypothetical protein
VRTRPIYLSAFLAAAGALLAPGCLRDFGQFEEGAPPAIGGSEAGEGGAGAESGSGGAGQAGASSGSGGAGGTDGAGGTPDATGGSSSVFECMGDEECNGDAKGRAYSCSFGVCSCDGATCNPGEICFKDKNVAICSCDGGAGCAAGEVCVAGACEPGN